MRCDLCPGINNCIQIDGPCIVGDPLFIGEAPGWEENKKGIPFVGKTGTELNGHYLPLAGLMRDNITITNAIKCLPDRPKGKLDLSREKDKELLNICAFTHLYAEIRQLRPRLLIPMGAFACYAIDPDINLELHHGIPIKTRFGMAFPMYHPAQGIHEPKKMLGIRNDFIRLRRYLGGRLKLPVDPYPNPDYQEATSGDISSIDPTLPMGSDTEWSRSKGPYFVTWSQEPGIARLIKAEDSNLISKFQAKLDKWESYIYFHNWPYDWSITEDMTLAFPTKMSIARQMGLTFPMPMTRDTMMMAYHLGNLPQGLKALAYRLLGMKMQDFEDLVKPYSAGRIFDYWRLAQTKEWPRPEEIAIKDKQGIWAVKKPQSLKTKLKRLFTDLAKSESKDIFKVWDTWEDHQSEIEEKCGPYYPLDIADVPIDEAAYYAMRDSDAEIRLVPVLLKMREIAMSGKLQELWDI